LGVALSGSGSTIVAFTRSAQTVARAMEETLKSRGITARTFTTRPHDKGALELIEIQG